VDSFVTILPLPALPFFIFLWIICAHHFFCYLLYPDLIEHLANISVCAFPIDILPSVYRYGYAFPFYNVSRGIRTVIFATRNRGGEFVDQPHKRICLSNLLLCSWFHFRSFDCMDRSFVFQYNFLPMDQATKCDEATSGKCGPAKQASGN